MPFLGNIAHDFNTLEIKGKEILWDTTNYRWNEVFEPGKEYVAPFDSKVWR
ncbi:MAG: hypothetical protein P4L53_18480 [Candidatus Obscuribacterales bacterium]|nr:hypothetical protein [Candidatus Obscuribacterales bacterium]